MAYTSNKTNEFKTKIDVHMHKRAVHYANTIEAAKDALWLGAREFDINMASNSQPLVEKIVLDVTIKAISVIPFVGGVVSSMVSTTHAIASTTNANDQRREAKLKTKYLLKVMRGVIRRLNVSKSKCHDDYYAVKKEIATRIGKGQEITNGDLQQYKIKYRMVDKLTIVSHKKIENRMLKELVKAHCKKYGVLLLRNWPGRKYELLWVANNKFQSVDREQLKWIMGRFTEINTEGDLHKWGVKRTELILKMPKEPRITGRPGMGGIF